MKQKKSLRFEFSLGFLLIAFFTVMAILFSANVLITRQFNRYIKQSQKEFADSLAQNIASQYDPAIQSWNLDYIHGFGMYALDDGYVIKLFDADGNSLWDAENHDMALCHAIMANIEEALKHARSKSSLMTQEYELNADDGSVTGSVKISYYSPYFSSKNDFDFLSSLNAILFRVGFIALIIAVVAGFLYAEKVIKPIKETVGFTKKISQGNYNITFKSKSSAYEIQELQSAVSTMAKSLDEQEKREKTLTRDVAHELRTPLANISSYLEAMAEGALEASPERLNECVEEITRLKTLISDLEELHKIEDLSLSQNKTLVDLHELSKKVSSSFDSSLKKAGLRCSVIGEAGSVLADEKRLHQILVNLISNAIKYTKTGDNIIIETGKTFFKVINHGEPISQKDVAHLFERFYRADDSRSRKTGGSGLGLAIVKALADSQNATVSVTSDEKETCFAVVFNVS